MLSGWQGRRPNSPVVGRRVTAHPADFSAAISVWELSESGDASNIM